MAPRNIYNKNKTGVERRLTVEWIVGGCKGDQPDVSPIRFSEVLARLRYLKEERKKPSETCHLEIVCAELLALGLSKEQIKEVMASRGMPWQKLSKRFSAIRDWVPLVKGVKREGGYLFEEKVEDLQERSRHKSNTPFLSSVENLQKIANKPDPVKRTNIQYRGKLRGQLSQEEFKLQKEADEYAKNLGLKGYKLGR